MRNYEKELLNETDNDTIKNGEISQVFGEDLVYEFEEKELPYKYLNGHYYRIKSLCKVIDRYFIVEWLRGTDEIPYEFENVYEIIPKEMTKSSIVYERKDYKIKYLFDKIENILGTYLGKVSYDIDYDINMLVVTDYSNGEVFKILQENISKDELEILFFCFKDK